MSNTPKRPEPSVGDLRIYQSDVDVFRVEKYVWRGGIDKWETQSKYEDIMIETSLGTLAYDYLPVSRFNSFEKAKYFLMELQRKEEKKRLDEQRKRENTYVYYPPNFDREKLHDQ